MTLWLLLACAPYQPSGGGEGNPRSCAHVQGATRREIGSNVFGDAAIYPCRTLGWGKPVLVPAAEAEEPGRVLIGSETTFKIEGDLVRDEEKWPGREYNDGSVYESRAIVYRRAMYPDMPRLSILEDMEGEDIETPQFADPLSEWDAGVNSGGLYADFDGDGIDDLHLVGHPDYSASWIPGTADGLSIEPADTIIPLSLTPVGDLTGDGVTDLARFVNETTIKKGAETEVLRLAIQSLPVSGPIEDASWDVLLGTDLFDRETYGLVSRNAFHAFAYGGFDHNGDGIADVVVGNRFPYELEYPARGSINVFDGPILESRTGDEVDALLSRFGANCEEVMGSDKCDSVGTYVKSGGDVNADGYEDLLVGSQYSRTMGPHAMNGALFVVPGPLEGNMDIDLVSTARLEGGYNGAMFPDFMQGRGDLDGDGRSDLLVAQGSYRDEGGIYLHYGPVEGVMHWQEGTFVCGDWYGSGAFSFDQDIDHDGIHDLVYNPGDPSFSIQVWFSSVSTEFPRADSDCMMD